jgi:hypothetical protein
MLGIYSTLKKIIFTLPQFLTGRRKFDHLVQGDPTPQKAIDIFSGNWASRLPIINTNSGKSELFNDDRIRWFLDRIGGVRGKSIVELGPLEGGHTYMLDRAGAKSVVAIESNANAWLKCLVAKELIGINSAHFLLGDFMDYLRTPGPQFDACIACGVLYHLKDPHTLFPLLRARCSGPVFIWSAIWSEQIQQKNKRLHLRFSTSREVVLPTGKVIELHRHEYGLSSLFSGFWGGNSSYSEWMSREGIMSSAEAGGYIVKEIVFDDPDHQNSPAIAFLLQPI